MEHLSYDARWCSETVLILGMFQNISLDAHRGIKGREVALKIPQQALNLCAGHLETPSTSRYD